MTIVSRGTLSAPAVRPVFRSGASDRAHLTACVGAEKTQRRVNVSSDRSAALGGEAQAATVGKAKGDGDQKSNHRGSKDPGDPPTLAEAGIDKKPRQARAGFNGGGARTSALRAARRALAHNMIC